MGEHRGDLPYIGNNDLSETVLPACYIQRMSMRSVWGVAIGALIAASIPTGANAAAVSAIQTANGPVFGWTSSPFFAALNQSAAVGWSFQVLSSDLNVVSVGVFDDQNGLADAHELGIWDSSHALLLDVTVPAGTAGTLINSYRYTDVSPITLTAGGTYFIAAFYPGKATTSAAQDHLLINSNQTYSGVQFVNSVQTFLGVGIPFGFPSQNAGVNQGVFGPNFRFDVAAAAPEPASSSLAGVAIILLGSMLRRSSRRR